MNSLEGSTRTADGLSRRYRASVSAVFQLEKAEFLEIPYAAFVGEMTDWRDQLDSSIIQGYGKVVWNEKNGYSAWNSTEISSKIDVDFG